MPARRGADHLWGPCAGPAAVAVIGRASRCLEKGLGRHHPSWGSFLRSLPFARGPYSDTRKGGNHIRPNDLERWVAECILDALRDVGIGQHCLGSTSDTKLILFSDGHSDQSTSRTIINADRVVSVVRSQRPDLTITTANAGSLDEASRSLRSNDTRTAVVSCWRIPSSRGRLQKWSPWVDMKLRHHVYSDRVEQGTVVLKMLQSAIDDGDNVEAVLLEEGASDDSRCACTPATQGKSNAVDNLCDFITLPTGRDTMDFIRELSRKAAKKENSLSGWSGRRQRQESGIYDHSGPGDADISTQKEFGSDSRGRSNSNGGTIFNGTTDISENKYEASVKPEDSTLCVGSFRDREHFLTYNLLIELLSFQFTFPVRWIQTQVVILAEFGVQRLIEIGPGKTLTHMAQQTLRNTTLGSPDAPERLLLSYTSDTDKIYYREAPCKSETEESNPALEKGLEPTPISQPIPEMASMDPTDNPACMFSDSAVEVKDILRVILGSKTRRRSTDIPMSSTIRASAGGRSTLQNELVGEIDAELGRLPDGAEDMTLEALHNHFQPSFNGQLGPHCRKIIKRMMAKRIPPSLDESSIRRYLVDSYGLGKGRQDTILLFVSTVLPDHRSYGEGEAYRLLDKVIEEYAREKGIYISKMVPKEHGAMGPVAKFQDGQGQTGAVVHASLELVPTAVSTTDTIASQLQEKLRELQTELDVWTDEHGLQYAEGLVAKFCIRKQRVYDSWWNWGLQRLWLTYTQLQMGAARLNEEGTQAAIKHILNCPSTRLVQAVRRMLESTPSPEDVDVFLRQLHRGLEPQGTPTLPRHIAISIDQNTLVDNSVQRLRLGSSHYSSDNSSQDHVCIRTNAGGSSWPEDPDITAAYRQVIHHAITEGVSFADHHVLVIGSGPQSIGARILQNLLAGGAHVLVTTSSLSSATAQFYSDIYASFGGKGSRLVLVPYNQASVRDVTALVDYIYNPISGLGWDLDHVLPFAAVSGRGGEIDGIDSRSELAHRAMMTNTIRLLGAIKTKKAAMGSRNRPTQVIVPLSPNHGMFGGDGLYSESKLGLESLLHRWYSESWQEWLSISGAIIGWTRGTGLMGANDRMAGSLADVGVRTFSTQQMADYLTGLLAGPMMTTSQLQPVLADLSGGLSCSTKLTRHIKSLQRDLNEADLVRRALLEEQALEAHVLGHDALTANQSIVRARASPHLSFPPLLDHAEVVRGIPRELQGMVDLSRAVVIVGFSEIGPFGNSRTRWDVECNGGLSVESCIELAWMTGRIKHFNGLINGNRYCGWVDVQQDRPIHEADMKARFEQQLLTVCGIREIHGPSTDIALQEITLQQDLGPLDVSHDEALQLQARHGASIEVIPAQGKHDGCTVILKKGATIYCPGVPSTGSTRVAGRIPDGWDPAAYGIPDRLAEQLDPVAIYALVGTVEALLSAGITDPYELYQHVPISGVANCLGSGLGGTKSLQAVFRDRPMDRQTPPDVLQETFVNTTAAWVNMLLLSGAGPMRTPVGACATALESMDTGRDLIASGRAQVCLVGGVDDLCTEVSQEFGRMNATVDVGAEQARGRSPAEMSRPGTSSRCGFVESHGCGVQILASAELALAMGLPIYGVVALTGTASDQISRSVPAPGKGIATLARESTHAASSPTLDVRYRRRLLELQQKFTKQSVEAELSYLDSAHGERVERTLDYNRERDRINHAARLRDRDALRRYSTEFWKETDISPIRGSLAVWGLTPNDVLVASLHGTSTPQGDRNEIELIHQTMEHLGRRPGNPVLAVCQKYLTGHPKGPAGAWMVNGCLQILQSGIVPGNRNADNIDVAFEAYSHVLLLRERVEVGQIEACSVTSFGFGQKGAQAILVHPRRLLAVLESGGYEEYGRKARMRQQQASRRFQQALLERNMFRAKDEPPYPAKDMMSVFLRPGAMRPALV